jgi:DNA polymerase III sliding clamp (beta) subunit (PCNA family)
MQPITLPVDELKAAITGLGKVIGPRPSLAILGNIKVERTADGWIALTSTDLDRFVTLRLEHPAAGPPATILLPYDQLAQVVKNCGRGEAIEVEASPEASIIASRSATRPGNQRSPSWFLTSSRRLRA